MIMLETLNHVSKMLNSVDYENVDESTILLLKTLCINTAMICKYLAFLCKDLHAAYPVASDMPDDVTKNLNALYRKGDGVENECEDNKTN